MLTISLTQEADYGEWAAQARALYQSRIKPENVFWESPGAAKNLFGSTPRSARPAQPAIRNARVPKDFISIGKRVICHSDPERFARLYRLLWRLQNHKTLLSQSADPDIVWLTSRDKAVRRDRHKMHAFVRFRKTGLRKLPSGETREQFISWFEPDHYILELSASFFVKRFTNMDWAILTPYASVFWNGKTLVIGNGAKKSDINIEDSCEDLWKTYFASTFNPARLKVNAMMSEMPKKYWHNLPEAVLIPDLIAKAQGRTSKMTTEAVTSPNPLAAKIKANLTRKLL